MASNVYINPDLSPAELQLAFERRQARRVKLATNRDHDRQRSVIQNEVLFPFLSTSEEFPPINDRQPGSSASASALTTSVPASCSLGFTITTAGTPMYPSKTVSDFSTIDETHSPNDTKSQPYTVVNSSRSSFRNN